MKFFSLDLSLIVTFSKRGEPHGKQKAQRFAGRCEEVNKMKIEITGEPKEIAALVLAVQERQCEAVVEATDWAGNVAVVTEES